MKILQATYKKQRLVFKSYHPWLMIFNRIVTQTIRIITLYYLSSYFMSLDDTVKKVVFEYRVYLFSNILLLSFVVATIVNTSRYLINELHTGTLINLIMVKADLVTIHLGVFFEQALRNIFESFYSLVLFMILGINIPNIISFRTFICLILLTFICILLSILVSVIMLSFRETFVIQNMSIFIITIFSGTYFRINFSNTYLNNLISNTPLSFIFRLFRGENITFIDILVFIFMFTLLIFSVLFFEKNIFFKKLDNYVE